MSARVLTLPDGATLHQDGSAWELKRGDTHMRYLSSFEAEFIATAMAAGVAEASAALRSAQVKPAEPALVITLRQAKALVEWFGGDDSEITVSKSGDSLICWFTEYPEEGHLPLGKTEVEETGPEAAPARAISPRM